jgi:hypothetical protein
MYDVTRQSVKPKRVSGMNWEPAVTIPTLRWRLRFEASHACGFDIMMDLNHFFRPHSTVAATEFPEGPTPTANHQ